MRKFFIAHFIFLFLLTLPTLLFGQIKSGKSEVAINEEHRRSNMLTMEAILKRHREQTYDERFVVNNNPNRQKQTELSSVQSLGWQTGYGLPNGLEGSIKTFARDSSGNVYIGGVFSWAGDIAVNNIVKWYNGTWSALGSGVDGKVYAILPLSGDTVLVGGDFHHAGGIVANYIALWDGAHWSNFCDSLDSFVLSMIRSKQGEVYIGGNFGRYNYVAKRDGSCWSRLGTGRTSGVNGIVTAMAYLEDTLMIGGDFNYTGTGLPAIQMALWYNDTMKGWWSNVSKVSGLATRGKYHYVTGSNYIRYGTLQRPQPLPTDFSPIYGIGVDTGVNVYVNGMFINGMGTKLNCIARWDGVNWSGLTSGGKTGVNSYGDNSGGGVVYTMKIYGKDIYVGGDFNLAGAKPASNVGLWNGSEWMSIPSSTSKGIAGGLEVIEIAPNGDLYFGGFFSQAGNVPTNSIARLHQGEWSSLGSGVTGGGVKAIAFGHHGEVYAAGCFKKAGDDSVNHIAMWDGSHWTAMGRGIDDCVNALAVDVYGNLYAGGRGMFMWDGTSWYTVGTSGLATTVDRIAIDANGEIYLATGYYSGGLVKLNGNDWEPVGGGLGGYANAIAIDGNNIYVGGFFNTAGSVPLNNMARWDGQAWHAVGSGPQNGVQGVVYTIDVDNQGKVFVGGYFTDVGGIYSVRVAYFDGSKWNAMGNGLDNDVFAIAHDANNVYFGGAFKQAGNVAASSIAVWQQRATGVEEERGLFPNTVELEQNYPNPFNPSTIIRYQLPANGFVRLKVYNILGKEVTTLVNEVQYEGLHTVSFNGNTLPSGLYYYKLQSGDQVVMKKMILLK